MGSNPTPSALSGAVKGLMAFLGCSAYLIISRVALQVYDPVWLAIAAFREGDSVVGMGSLLFGGALVLGMIGPFLGHWEGLYTLSALSIIAWVLFCVGMEALVFA